VENVQREDISPLEAAEAYKRLMDEFTLTQEQVASRVGKSRPAIANTLRLLKLPPMIRESLSRGQITEGHARSLLSVPDPEWQERVWRRILDENLTVRATESLSAPSEPESTQGFVGAPDIGAEPDVSRETSRKRREKRRDPDLGAVEDRLRMMLGTRVRIKGTTASGSIVVDYFSEEDLHRLAALLGLA
jgi:ParB family chromosome partitioning protein